MDRRGNPSTTRSGEKQDDHYGMLGVPTRRRSALSALVEVRWLTKSMKSQHKQRPNCRISIQNGGKLPVNQRDKRLAFIIVGMILLIPLAIGLLNTIVALIIDTFL
jgi:hypothetical protein